MWLAIEGIVGAGKTTTAELIGGRRGWMAGIERSEDHPFLEDYYRAPDRYALETELGFMLIQLHQVRDLDLDGKVVTDFAPGKNLIFATTNSSPADQRFLSGVHHRLWADLPQPDIAIVLDPPVDVCLKRIAKRGRQYEQGIEASDMTNLRGAYLDSIEVLADRVLTLPLAGTEAPIEVADAVVELANSE